MLNMLWAGMMAAGIFWAAFHGNMGEVTDAKRAQVEDIVKRKTNVSAENVIITPIVVGEVDTE